MNQPVYNPAPYPQPPCPPSGQPAPLPYPGPAYAPPQAGQPYPGYAPACPVYPAYPAYVQPAGPRFTAAKARDLRKTGGRRAVNLASVLVLAQVLAALVFQVIMISAAVAAGYNVYYDDLGMVWLTIAMSPLTTASPFLVYMLLGKKDWNQYLRFEKTGFFTGLLCVLAGLGVCLAANYPAFALSELLERLGAEPADSILGQSQSIQGFFLELAGVAVLVPMLEEFAFRGVLLSSLRRYGTGFAVVASGLLFGMAHLDMSSAVFASIAGFAMGFFYVRTNNLWVPVCIHMLNNALSVTGSYAELLAGPRAELLQELLELVPVGVGVLALLLLPLAFYWERRSGRRRSEDAPPAALPALRAGESVACIAQAPAFWGVVLLVLVNTGAMFL